MDQILKVAATTGLVDAVTNPSRPKWMAGGYWAPGGQNVDDVFKYIDSDDRLGMMEAMCRWRCCAPNRTRTLCTDDS